MNYREFLGTVLSDQGAYCIVGLKENSPTKQVFLESFDDIDAQVRRLLGKDYNIYFGCAKYGQMGKRIKENALFYKTLFMDLDVDPDDPKKFSSKQQALEELVEFCNKIEIGAPGIVDSGNGFHCYWPFNKTIPRHEWKALAERLKTLCKDHQFRADPAVTADEARILRLPGTLNFKRKPYPEVEVIFEPTEIDVDLLKVAIAAFNPLPPTPSHIKPGLSPLMKKLVGDRKFSFQKIVERIVEGKGCAQLEYILTKQEEIPEPLWRAGLSIARNCVDWEIAVHAISDQHEDYSREETELKADRLENKPYRCDIFESLNPEKCEGCPHKERIRSPIVLGTEIQKAPVEEEVLEVEEEGLTVLYPIPPMPYPFFRAKNGGVYKDVKDEEPKLVYENDLFIVKRMRDKDRGELVLARIHLPKDKPKEFVIPLSVMSSKEELRKLLAGNGCICMPNLVDGIMGYLVECAKFQQFTNDAEVLRQQMGWVEDNSRFVVGDKEISATEIRYSPPSETTLSVAQWMHCQGEYAEWQKVANVYNKPGFEPHAFAVLTALGAPLMRHSNYKGAFINLINKDSGTGKTTILRMINSFYGHPNELMSKESDTLAHKLFRLGVLNNLAFTADELTNMKPEDISRLLYSVSQGQGPGRMQALTNMERKNDTTWSTIGIGSSNASMTEVLASHKSMANGEVMRLLEYRINATNLLDKREAYKLFEETLNKNYGMAGQLFIKWLVSNLPEAIKLYHEVQAYIDDYCKFSNRDRYWSAVIAANITGGLIAVKLGILDWDIQRILKWALDEMVPDLRRAVSDQKVSNTDFLGQFINQNVGNTLVIRDSLDPKTNLPCLPLQEPRNHLLIRMEPDTKLVYVSSKVFKEYCAEHRVICNDLLKTMKAEGLFLKERKKRLGKGTKVVGAPPVNTYVFQYEFDESFLGGVGNADSHN